MLSFLYLWTIKSILSAFSWIYERVVNCFHFCIFELSKASQRARLNDAGMLWIAFIFVSLNYQKHLNYTHIIWEKGCELLSFLYLWTIKSIRYLLRMRLLSVVNCFHFCIFELSKASTARLALIDESLWIAFIFVSLNYQKHQ